MTSKTRLLRGTSPTSRDSRSVYSFERTAEATFDDHNRLRELIGVVDVGDECRGVPVVAEHERENRRVLTADDSQRDVATEQVVRLES